METVPVPTAFVPPRPPTQGTLSKYGLTAEEWLKMCADCDYTCVVCGKPFEERPLVVDHEHVKGFKARKKKKAKQGGHIIKVRKMPQSERRKHVRGVIHNYCNRFVRSWLTLERAKAIVLYLEAFDKTKKELAAAEALDEVDHANGTESASVGLSSETDGESSGASSAAVVALTPRLRRRRLRGGHSPTS